MEAAQSKQDQQHPKVLDLCDLENIIEQVSGWFAKIYVFLDAPNESKEAATILRTLFGLLKKSDVLRIMLSSTEALDAPVGISLPAYMTVPMDQNQIARDIKDYVETWLEKEERLRMLPEYLKEEIKTKLALHADGVYAHILSTLSWCRLTFDSFRWVQCQIESLVDKRTTKDIRNALHNVPATLEQTYRNILARIPEGDIHLAQQLLLCICFANTRLTFEELCEAVVIGDDCLTLDEDMRLLHPDDLLNICSSLISYDVYTSTVALAHSSVWTYLTSSEIRCSDVSRFALDYRSAQNAMARKCINYLSLPEFRSGYCTNDMALARRLLDWPFLEYSADNWPAHLRSALQERSDLEPTTQTLVMAFFDTAEQAGGGAFVSWIQAYVPTAPLDIIPSKPLYYAARFGLLAIVRLMLATGGIKDLEARGGRVGSTPLHVAAAFGETEVVRALLAAGADVRERNAIGETGLYWATIFGYEEIVGLLKEAGATLKGVTPMTDYPQEIRRLGTGYPV